MKTITCNELGGPCDEAFHVGSADNAIKAQDVHLKEMVAKGDVAHADAAAAMKARWHNPIKGMGWYMQMKKDFAALPKD
jgi:hypothetical protein